VLELIGVTTLTDSLHCAKERGVVCMTGLVGNKWSFDNFKPMEVIPTAAFLTIYAGEAQDFMRNAIPGFARTSRVWRTESSDRNRVPLGRNRRRAPIDGGKQGGRQDRGAHVERGSGDPYECSEGSKKDGSTEMEPEKWSH
jgi:hypothetical protein